jgi:Flp pilus assembly protein TadG
MKILRNDHGSTALEFALVVPVVLAFVLGTIQIAIMLWADNLLFFSVDLAARCAAVGSTNSPCQSTMAATVTNAMPSSSIGTLTTASNSNCTGNNVGVSATFTIDFLVFPWPKNSKPALHANSCQPKWS